MSLLSNLYDGPHKWGLILSNLQMQKPRLRDTPAAEGQS